MFRNYYIKLPNSVLALNDEIWQEYIASFNDQDLEYLFIITNEL